jgi:uncharacterized FAD-dependent dehydrogenase
METTNLLRPAWTPSPSLVGQVKVVIVGAGPAGLAAARRLVDCGVCNVLVLEAGDALSARTETAMLNGVGGAGLYSDRKFSALPAGTGLLSQNVYELRESFETVLQRLKRALPHTTLDTDALLASTLKCLGDQDVSSEQAARRSHEHRPLKLYPSLVLKDVADAASIIEAFMVPMIVNGATVKNVQRLEKEVAYTVTYECQGQQTHIKADYVLMATGRFGPWSWPPGLGSLCPGRLEIGLRVELSSCAALMTSLKACGVADPKYCLDTHVTVEGKHVPCQVRTFCVCTTGYMAYCHDCVTNCHAVSASSSVSELMLRNANGCSKFQAEASVGIMLRWTDPAFVERWRDVIKRMCSHEPKRFTLDLTSEVAAVECLQDCFPHELCAAILQGTKQMLQTITGQSSYVIVVHGPCMEGAGAYPSSELPDLCRSPSLAKSTPDRVFVAGDLGGRSRGLLQALVDGDMAAKRIMSHHLDAQLHDLKLLHKYQSVYLPGHVYNKTLALTLAGPAKDLTGLTRTDWSGLYAGMLQTLHVYFDTLLRDLDANKPREEFLALDAIDMHAVRHTGTFGVLYELHHFFLDDAAMKATGGLHVISEQSLLQYMLACNAIQACLPQLGVASFRLADINADDDSVTPEAMFTAHPFKACVLALRTRPSVPEREEYVDWPIMQSAYKLLPKQRIRQADVHPSDAQRTDPSDAGETNEPGRQADIKLVAAAATLLDCCFKTLIAKHGLEIMLHRTKIETQEPGVVSCDQTSNPPYLECHVKLNMRRKDGTKLSYEGKKEAIQAVASLFEGDKAPHAGIFRVLAVSINLLKHPEHGQQFFLTFRTDTKADMRAMRRAFSHLITSAVSQSGLDLACQCIPDAEVVIYDNKRDMDAGWFPVTHDFLEPDYASNMCRMFPSCE